MRFSNFLWAMVLIAIGLLFLFSNFGWIDFQWAGIWRLWPLILVFWGITILPVRDLIKAILVIGFLGLTFIFFNQITEPRWTWTFSDHEWTFSDDWNDDNDKGRTFTYSTQELSVPMDSLSSKAILVMDAAAGKFYIDGMTSEMMQFRKEGDIGDYSMTTERNNGKTEIRIDMEKNTKVRRVKKNRIDIQLNRDMVWDLDLDIGAAAVKMDLSAYQIDTVKIDAGAASIEMKLGNRRPETFVTYSAGAASLEVKIPRDAACEIRSESVLVSREFEGFNKKGDGVYQTPNYPEGSCRIVIEIESAVSSLKVDRY